MRLRWSAKWLCLIPLVVSVSRLGSIMHESDQAALVLGALRLVNGDASWIGADLYEYGNYFGSYWILALLLKLFPMVDVLWLGNAAGLFLFWGGVLCLLLSGGWSPRSSLALFVILISPAVLVHSPYFAPVFLSSGFLCAGAAVYRRFSKGFAGAVLCWLMAFACRADAMLLVPLLAWVVSEEESFSGLLRCRRSWILVGVALGVAATGRLLDPAGAVLAYMPFFHFKVYAVYLIFGAAGATGLLALILWALLQKGRSFSDWDHRLFWWSAFGALLVPFVFYSVFMFTTRHWILMISALMLMLGSGRVSFCFERKSVLLTVLILGSVLLLFVGIQLPEKTKPVLTLSKPELFPTTDGRCPMGAVLPFLFSGQRLDHNHQTWAAAQEVAVWDEVDGAVPLRSFPLVDIVCLSIYLRGQPAAVFGEALPEPPFVYVSSRAAIKPKVFFDSKNLLETAGDIVSAQIRLVGGKLPVSILRVVPDQDGWSDEKKEIVLFRQVFQGNDVSSLGRVDRGSVFLPPATEGRVLLLWAMRPFTLTIGSQVVPAQCAADIPDRDVWFVRLAPNRAEFGALKVSEPVDLVTTVYPEYMNIHSF